MRRYIYIFGLTVLFWGTSCADFINIQPENATTYSNYYKNEKELEAVLTGLQVYLRQWVSLPVAIFPEPERYWITTDLCARG